jgi:hypothetical protein
MVVEPFVGVEDWLSWDAVCIDSGEVVGVVNWVSD